MSDTQETSDRIEALLKQLWKRTEDTILELKPRPEEMASTCSRDESIIIPINRLQATPLYLEDRTLWEGRHITEAYSEELRTRGADGTRGHFTQRAIYTRADPPDPSPQQEPAMSNATQFIIDKLPESRANMLEHARREPSSGKIIISKTSSNEWHGTELEKESKTIGKPRKAYSDGEEQQKIRIKVVRPEKPGAPQQPESRVDLKDEVDSAIQFVEHTLGPIQGNNAAAAPPRNRKDRRMDGESGAEPTTTEETDAVQSPSIHSEYVLQSLEPTSRMEHPEFDESDESQEIEVRLEPGQLHGNQEQANNVNKNQEPESPACGEGGSALEPRKLRGTLKTGHPELGAIEESKPAKKGGNTDGAEQENKADEIRAARSDPSFYVDDDLNPENPMAVQSPTAAQSPQSPKGAQSSSTPQIPTQRQQNPMPSPQSPEPPVSDQSAEKVQRQPSMSPAETREILEAIQEYSRTLNAVSKSSSEEFLEARPEADYLPSISDVTLSAESQDGAGSLVSAKEIYGVQFDSDDYELVTYDFKIRLSPEGARVMSARGTREDGALLTDGNIAASIEITPEAVRVNDFKVWEA